VNTYGTETHQRSSFPSTNLSVGSPKIIHMTYSSHSASPTLTDPLITCLGEVKNQDPISMYLEEKASLWKIAYKEENERKSPMRGL